MEQREGRGGAIFSLRIGGCEQRRCVWCVLVTAQQLHHMSAWEGEGEASPLFSPPLLLSKQPHTGRLMLLPWRWGVLVIGAHTYSQAVRENRGLLSPKLGKDAIISHLSIPPPFSDRLPHSLVVSLLLKIACLTASNIGIGMQIMNRLMSSPQWPPHSGMSGDNRRLKRGRGRGADDNRDNGDKNTVVVHSQSSKRAPSPFSSLIVFL